MERSKEDQALIEQMRPDLRGLDDEAIADWWLNRARGKGWPACVQGLVHNDLPVEHLRKLEFSKMEVRLARSNITDGDWGPIAPRIEYLKTRNNALVTDDVRKSLEFQLAHFKSHKSFVHPVILEENPPDIFRVLDANHRFATYFYLRGDFGIEIEGDKGFQVPEKLSAWIGRLK